MSDKSVRLNKLWTLAVLFTSPLFLAGCGSTSNGPVTYSVSGQVSYDGTPVTEGQILFRNLGSDGRGYQGEIKDGQYQVRCEAGEMRVEITASRPTGKMQMSEDKVLVPVMQMYIPEKYNAKSTLKTTVQPQSQTIPFDLAK